MYGSTRAIINQADQPSRPFRKPSPLSTDRRDAHEQPYALRAAGQTSTVVEPKMPAGADDGSQFLASGSIELAMLCDPRKLLTPERRVRNRSASE